jgi:hypothetical protein
MELYWRIFLMAYYAALGAVFGGFVAVGISRFVIDAIAWTIARLL